jgi:4'-phosphopantetheinyl transferase
MGALARVLASGTWPAASAAPPGTAQIGAPSQREVHAWVIHLDAPTDSSGCSRSLLDDAERHRAASYLSPRDGARFAASRTGLRSILGRYLGADPAALSFRTVRGGRPVLAGEHGRRLQFSLSRGAGVALVVVSAGPGAAGSVGADIEAIVPRDGLVDLAAARFGPAEAACIASGGCTGSPLRSFYRHWTAREAWLKALGIGLSALSATEFDCQNDLAIRFRGTTRPAPDLRLQLLEISPDHAAAVAAAGPVTGIWRLPASQ